MNSFELWIYKCIFREKVTQTRVNYLYQNIRVLQRHTVNFVNLATIKKKILSK